MLAQLSPDGGILALRDIEQRPGIADRLTASVTDPCQPQRIIHSVVYISPFQQRKRGERGMVNFTG